MYDTGLEFSYLFPAPEEDTAYGLLLNLSKEEWFKQLIEMKLNVFHEGYIV